MDEGDVLKENLDVMKQGERKGNFLCSLIDLKYNYVGHIGYLVRLEALLRDKNAPLRIKKSVPKCRFLYLEDINRFTQELYENDGIPIYNSRFLGI